MKKKYSRPAAALACLAFAFGTGTALASPPKDAPVAGQVTLDAATRLRLVRSAADRAGLKEVGLDFRDVYGVIHAETSWVPRTGMGRNGVASQGLGQFEPATARAVGLRDPNDAVEAVYAAARLLREAAVWSAQRIAGLGLQPEQRAAKLREGVSIYYNLSSRARNAWSGLNTENLPTETLRHIRNVRAGARQADQLNARFGGPSLPPLPTDTALAALASKPSDSAPEDVAKSSEPKELGTIEWSGEGGPGPRAGHRSYVVLSNGAVRPQGKGEVPAGAIRFTPRSGG